MSKAHGKGQGISINGSGGTSHLNDWKMKMAHAAEGLPVREWKPYVPSKAMEIACDRAKELYALPSLVR